MIARRCNTYASCCLPSLHWWSHYFATPWWKVIFSKNRRYESFSVKAQPQLLTTCSSHLHNRWFGSWTVFMKLTLGCRMHVTRISFFLWKNMWMSYHWRLKIGRYLHQRIQGLKILSSMSSRWSIPPWCSHCSRLISLCTVEWMWESRYYRTKST